MSPARTTAAERVQPGGLVLLCLASWAVPGLGHLWLDRRSKGLIFLVAIPLMFAIGLALHVANGAVFGAAFERLGLQGVKAGVVAAEVENTLLWPTMAIFDRIHPDRRDGTWPPLVSDARVAVQEVVGHAIFGAVLGLLGDSERK